MLKVTTKEGAEITGSANEVAELLALMKDAQPSKTVGEVLAEIHRPIKRKKWMKSENDYLLANPTDDFGFLARKLNRSTAAIKLQLKRLGLASPRSKRKQRGRSKKSLNGNKTWTAAEDHYLRTTINLKTNREMGNVLGRSETSVTSRLHNVLKLKRG